ncbi:MAG: hypothetical protein KatS3mg111_2958 [Pirellulaceae bacterium]|nr:MAG: hypothetical protein KatS3mg111_2958 [Pirellulaceae bacterium]
MIWNLRRTDLWLAVLLFGLLGAIDTFLGRRPLALGVTLAMLWFFIALILLTRPPALPELRRSVDHDDDTYVLRRDVIPRLPWGDRLRLSTGVACGCLLLYWVTLTFFAN